MLVLAIVVQPKLKCCYLEVATEPPMDLISKLIRPYRLA